MQRHLPLPALQRILRLDASVVPLLSGWTALPPSPLQALLVQVSPLIHFGVRIRSKHSNVQFHHGPPPRCGRHRLSTLHSVQVFSQLRCCLPHHSLSPRTSASSSSSPLPPRWKVPSRAHLPDPILFSESQRFASTLAPSSSPSHSSAMYSAEMFAIFIAACTFQFARYTPVAVLLHMC